MRLSSLAAIAAGGRFSLAPGWQDRVAANRAMLEAMLAAGGALYGVNTGFGKLASTRIDASKLAELQVNLVRSHAAGTGPALPAPVVRLAIALHAAGLARGASGVRPAVVEALLALEAKGVVPKIPSQGSVGASGDLAPLAHLALVLIGEGEVLADSAPAAAVAPLVLAPKEGLALLNGTRISTALALCALFRLETLFAASLVAGALSVDGARGADTPFDARVHEVRGQPGQAQVARALAALMAGSAIRDSHRSGDIRVQDPYSLRCQPQVAGACLDLIDQAAQVLEREANAVTDNPLVFDGAVISGGNFHAMPVSLAADQLALAIATLGNIAERRIALLVDPATSGLPAFLAPDSGLHSGFMIAQVTAAALTAENRALATPRSIETLPTSANQEDHVSMATGAALRLAPMLDNLAAIVGIEALAAAQAVEFHRPLASSAPLEKAVQVIRARVPAWGADRRFAPDLEAARDLLGELAALAPIRLPSRD
ncbi:MAG: histidine ammonia-lyase [Acetobacteraceae bacterium]|nr:histidine ammonia-lyase [Acetobacteraceae bacterium]